MAQDQSLTVSLEEFGLSKYEAQAYVTLITRGNLSASELAYYSDLPRTKVYPTLLRLEKKRLVIISKSKPIMCNAISPEDAFDDVIQEQIGKVNAMNSLVSSLKKVSEESKRSRGAEEKRYFHLAANNILDQLGNMIEGSKSAVHIMVDQWGLGLLAECKGSLVTILRRNLDVKIIIPPSQIGSENYKKIPNGAKVRVSEISQNCIIFDQTELLIIDSDNGRGAVLSSSDVLASHQSKIFANIWKIGIKTECLADMTKSEAQEIYRIIKIINEFGLTHSLNHILDSKKPEANLADLLEKNGIAIGSKSLEEMLEIIDSALQITCSGHAIFDDKNNNVTVESKLNSGNSLPWVSVLDGFLQKQGYKTKTIYQNIKNRGEKVHIKLSS
ncbi:MAG: TrmB family transcriptional regulator [Nitrosopumilaceae archaeon]|nr:TrmB family transcriptional regulator [Nitrosopumilaceae archaeon]NIU00567.1 TrmB family transcriptional regulator [Nitrosopumilaceae archaeon]NIU86953.1 TrmB family transcriptional regulator [Nitrosopumilaceae archaeon]NIV66417.1 TrmB family transcriptional regulator [Nitrosopumilaceae archaeon]NIX61169.1 TrmB family transcriptional regulator [Nitrosopumilaceae archaeon]